MPVAALVLVETSLAGNLGAAIRVAANFGVPALHLVRSHVELEDASVAAWACGGQHRIDIHPHDHLDEAVSGYRTVVASASARGREHQPVVSPSEALAEIRARGPESTVLVFGNETSGLARRHLDRCDLTVRIPTVTEFPVLNLAQSIAALLGYLAIQLDPNPPRAPEPAGHDRVAGLMEHLEASLGAIGFLDPANPDRILRKLRRLFGRAGITDNEVAILRGVCRQIDWATGQSRRDGAARRGGSPTDPNES
jgi:tRNA/rRNA methyltransferase